MQTPEKRLINISEFLSIGIHSLVFMARFYPQPVNVKQLSEHLNFSHAHLSKVLQRLHKSGLLKAIRGPKGGYTLAKKPSEITLIQIFETLEGPLPENFCLYSKPLCKGENCILGDLIKQILTLVKKYLSQTTLEDVKHVF